MTTLTDVRKFLYEKHIMMGLFGVRTDFEAEFYEKARAIHAAIIKENGLPSGIVELPDDTVLGDRSAELFDELVDWWTKNASPEPEEAAKFS